MTADDVLLEVKTQLREQIDAGDDRLLASYIKDLAFAQLAGGISVTGGSGGGGGSGDASASNQVTEIARLTSILGRLPTALSDGKFAVVDTASLAELTNAVTRLTTLVTNSVTLLTNQATQQAVIEAVRDRLPSALTSGKLSVSDSKVADIVEALEGNLTVTDTGVATKLTDITTALASVLTVSDPDAASSANQLIQLLRLEAIRDRLPTALASGKLTVTDADSILKLTDIITALTGNLSVSDTNANTRLTAIEGKLNSGLTTFNKSPVIYFEDSFTNLSANATFTGITRTTEGYTTFRAAANSNAGGVMYCENSSNGTTWRRTQQITLTAGTPIAASFLVMASFCRVVYVNGATAQTSFLLLTALLA